MSERQEARGSELRRSVGAYVTLVRLPNLFTAPPDVILGAALAADLGGRVSPTAVTGLAFSSVLLYAAGTTLNDYFDAAEDADVRPERPIPSNEVSRSGALAVGIALLVGGAGVALVTAGPVSGAVAGILALIIVLYDGVFKGGVAGFLFMGVARGTNVLLGTTAGISSLSFPGSTIAVPAVISLYIAGVTYMAESETGGVDRRVVAVGATATGLAAVAALGLALSGTGELLTVVLSIALTGGFLLWTGRELRAAYADPTPGTVGPAVGACVLGLVILDGAFAATVGPAWAAGAVVFFLPAVGLSRFFDVT